MEEVLQFERSQYPTDQDFESGVPSEKVSIYNANVNAVLNGKLDCYGAPHAIAPGTKECQGCKVNEGCARTAIDMVFAASKGVMLEGIHHDTRRIVNRVSSFMPKDYLLPKKPLHKKDLELILKCYERSQHFLPKTHTDEDLEKMLLELFPDADTPAMAVAAPAPVESSAKVLANVIRFPEPSFPETTVTTTTSPVATGTLAPPSSSVTCSTVASKELSWYSFPELDGADEKRLCLLSNKELADELMKLTKRRDADKKPVPYLAIRSEICAINAIMNLRGILPPYFRAWMSLPRLITGKKYTD